MINEILKSKPTILFLSILVGFFVFKLSIYAFLVIAIAIIVFFILFSQSKYSLFFILVSLSIGGLSSYSLDLDKHKIYKSTFSEYVKFKGTIESKISSNKFVNKYKSSVTITDDKLKIQSAIPVFLLIKKENQQYCVGDDIVGTGKLILPKPEYYSPKNRLENTHFQYGTIADLSVKYSSLDTESGNVLYRFNQLQISYIMSLIKEKFKSHSNIVSALLLGNKSGLDEELVNEFKATGVVHILSVSGFHISIISIGLYFLLFPVRNRWVKFIVLSICLFELVALTEFSVPAIKSALFTLLFLLSLNLKRFPNLIDISSASGLIMLLFDYTLLANISFLLSSFALLGIVVFSKPIYQALDRVYKGKFSYIKAVISTSFAAGFVTNIIVAYYFGTYSLLSSLSNLLVLPLYTLVLIYSVITLLLSQLWLSDSFAILTVVIIDIANFLNQRISDFNMLYIQDLSKALLVAFITPILIWYTLYSLSLRNFFIRVLVGLSIIILPVSLVNDDSSLSENKHLSSLEILRNNKNVLILKFKEVPDKTLLQATRSYIKQNAIKEVVCNYRFGLDSSIALKKMNTEFLNKFFKNYEN